MATGIVRLDIALAIAQRMREIVGDACEQHALDCGVCCSSDVFMCGTLRYLLALKFFWLRKVQELKRQYTLQEEP